MTSPGSCCGVGFFFRLCRATVAVVLVYDIVLVLVFAADLLTFKVSQPLVLTQFPVPPQTRTHSGSAASGSIDCELGPAGLRGRHVPGEDDAPEHVVQHRRHDDRRLPFRLLDAGQRRLLLRALHRHQSARRGRLLASLSRASCAALFPFNLM